MDILGRFLLYCVCMQAFCCPVFSAEWKAEVISNIDALTSSCVVIPCIFRYPGQKPTSRLSGFWHTLEGREKPIYAEEMSKVMDDFKGRTKLLGKLGQDNCTLEIDGVRDHDNGPFCFRIEIPDLDKFSFGQSCVNVKPKDDPDKPRLSHSERAYEGQPFSITCFVTHTCPSHMPELIWTGPSTTYITMHYKDNGHGIWEVQSTLSFIPNESDDDTDITCQAKFHGGKSSKNKISLRVKRSTGKVSLLQIVIPVTAVAVTVAIFGGLCFLMKKKYTRHLEALQNQGGTGLSMWSRISQLSRRRRPDHSLDGPRHERRSFWSRYSRTNNGTTTCGASKPHYPSPKSNHELASENNRKKDFGGANFNIYGNM